MVVDGGCGNIVPRGSFAQTPTDMTGLVPRGALAQASTATCISSDRWMNNSLQQNPCVVASYLQGVCVGGDFTVGPLSSGWFYGAPSGDEATACACSTVTYSMLAACSVCQDTLYLSWSSWCSNCSMISIGLYPMDIPAGTKVPNWAYLNVTAGFDPIAALNNGDFPESTATHVPSTTTTTVTYLSTLSASFITVYASLTSSSAAATGLFPSSTSTSSLTSSNVRTVAGGVVGGVIGGAAIISFVIWFLAKRHLSSKPSAAFNIGGGPDRSRSFYSTHTNTFSMTRQSRLYDPSNPTTFPSHSHSLTGLITSSSNTDPNPLMPSPVLPQQFRLGQYASIPQI
ncbi:uncharacterized protein EDB93DRAFT_542877 [Suillus bovinus]|uniref:uncharacterized protein n=1 Tax=Suillus bovinus TaxID=48563 RepID=UPI001B86462B|nr:uncharacterized protein EDB93DRAFT_542877 [Suillus bovinus]KAG2124405.1 hypothetical protein EDB93DRAFT_542877 [Suillus bovinus]